MATSTRSSGLADGVRRALYRFVVDRAEPVSKDEAAAHAGISRSLASYHLDRLADDGLLAVSYARRGVRRGPGAGRPAKLYAAALVDFNVQLPPRLDDALLARLLAGAVEADASGTTRAALLREAWAEGQRAAAQYRRLPGSLDDTARRTRLTAPTTPATRSGCGTVRSTISWTTTASSSAGSTSSCSRARSARRADGYCAVLEPVPDRCCVVLRRIAAEGARSDEGGEPACWAQLVCPDCGMLVSDGEHPGCTTVPDPER